MRHGTVTGYHYHRCRCDLCRAAWAVYYREYKHRTGRNQPLAVYLRTAIQHGHKRYKKGCRCEVCTAASREAKRRYRAHLHARGLSSQNEPVKSVACFAAGAALRVAPHPTTPRTASARGRRRK